MCQEKSAKQAIPSFGRERILWLKGFLCVKPIKGGLGEMERSLEGQNRWKGGISENRAIWCFPLKMPVDIQEPGYTKSV
jgi:hypothetical protein